MTDGVALLQANTYKLDHIGMNPSAESYLVLHRFGVSVFSNMFLTSSVVIYVYC